MKPQSKQDDMSICAINSISKRKVVFGVFCQESKKKKKKRQNAYFATIVLCYIWLNRINGLMKNTAEDRRKAYNGS